MAEASARVKILCCNIRKDLPQDYETGNGWEQRKDLCLEVIAARKGDVVCVQECTGGQFAFLRNGLGYESYGLSNPTPEYHPFNAIFFSGTRFDMVTAGGFWLSETPHVPGSKSWDSARPRFANWVMLKDRESGIDVVIWNSHFDHVGQTARENQARCLVEAAQAFPDTLPQLFAADCNANANNPAIQALKAGGWTDTYSAIHGPDDPGFTYHAFLGENYSPSGPENEHGKIDFIFARGPVKVVSADIIRESRNDRYPSDHYFLCTEVIVGA